MKTIACIQGSPEWLEARRGIPTASEFDRIITPKTGKPSEGARKYIAALLAEKYSKGKYEPSFATDAMEDGLRLEPQARRYYEYDQGVTVQQVGFITDDAGDFGCSPDALVGDRGLLEIKRPKLATFMEWVLEGELPDKFKPQLHAQLIVTDRDWVDWLAYYEGQPAFRIRVERNEYTIQVRTAMHIFRDKYVAAEKRYKVLDSGSAVG